MNINQPIVNEAVAQKILFQNQSPAKVGQVYDIVVDAMNQMQIPYSKQTAFVNKKLSQSANKKVSQF